MLLNSIPSPETSFSNHGDHRFVFDSEENPLVPLRLDLDLSLGPLQGKKPFQTKAQIDVAFLSDRRLCDSLSFQRFHELQTLHIMGVKHVISQLTPRNSRAKHINVRTLSFTLLTPLSACPADLLSYAGLVLCIVLTPASLRVSLQLFCSTQQLSFHRQFGWLLQENPIPKSTWSLSQLEIHPQFLCSVHSLHGSFFYSCPESRIWV